MEKPNNSQNQKYSIYWEFVETYKNEKMIDQIRK